MIIEEIRKRMIDKEKEGLIINRTEVEEILNAIEDELNKELVGKQDEGNSRL